MNQHAKVKIAILRSLKRMPKTYRESGEGTARTQGQGLEL